MMRLTRALALLAVAVASACAGAVAAAREEAPRVQVRAEAHRAQAGGSPAVANLPESCRVPSSALTAGSRALGLPHRGRLAAGVPLPEETDYLFTYELTTDLSPNPPWRRYGTEKLVLTVECVLARYGAAHPELARVGVSDLSLPRGGPFGRRYGGLGHRSHQNGLDVDVLYPRRDLCECAPQRPSEVDLRRAQELVNRFVRAGAQYVFVGPRLRLRGPRGVVIPLRFHDNHMHVRIYPARPARRRPGPVVQ